VGVIRHWSSNAGGPAKVGGERAVKTLILQKKKRFSTCQQLREVWSEKEKGGKF